MFESVIETSPLVSVIMNCYNGEKYLREAIDSVLSQTYTNWEVIFWDNQSTDSTATIVKSYSDKRIKYFYAPKHSGLYAARNCAIEKVNGEYIAFLDSDDIWYAEKLEEQLKLFVDNEVGFVCSNYNILNSQSNQIRKAFTKPIPCGYVFRLLAQDYRVGLLTLIIKKSAFDSLKEKFNSKFDIIGDYDAVFRLAMNFKMNASQEILAIYRAHAKNYSNDRKLFFHELKFWLKFYEKKIIDYDKKSFEILKNNYQSRLFKYYYSMNKRKEIIKLLSEFNLKLKVFSIILLLIPYRIIIISLNIKKILN